MPPRPIYRWKSFWFGLLGLVFLLWLWTWSVYRKEFVVLDPKLIGGSFASQYGTFAAPSPIEVRIPGERRALFYHSGLWLNEIEEKQWFPPALVATSQTTREPASIMVAWWLVTALYVGLWGAFLTWRWRRLKRLTKPVA